MDFTLLEVPICSGAIQAARRASGSPQETLQRFLVEFHVGEHMVCYDALP